MPCLYPRDGWRSQKTNENGKRPVVFKIREGYADQALAVPCGKCIGCSTDRARTWAVRMYHESTCHKQNSFLTLTYRDPAPESIDARHLQLFFKRMRKLYALRYFACGEYGEQTHRPHYHAIVFGQDFLGGAARINDELYYNARVEKLWGHGQVIIAAANQATMAYVAGYVNKKAGDPDTFNLMSRRPAIGRQYLDKYHDDLSRIQAAVIDGKENPIPGKYLEWRKQELEHVKNKQRAFMRNMSPEERWNRSETLRSKEINLVSKQKLKTGKI